MNYAATAAPKEGNLKEAIPPDFRVLAHMFVDVDCRGYRHPLKSIVHLTSSCRSQTSPCIGIVSILTESKDLVLYSCIILSSYRLCRWIYLYLCIVSYLVLFSYVGYFVFFVLYILWYLEFLQWCDDICAEVILPYLWTNSWKYKNTQSKEPHTQNEEPDELSKKLFH